jgi:hypothetical protein
MPPPEVSMASELLGLLAILAILTTPFVVRDRRDRSRRPDWLDVALACPIAWVARLRAPRWWRARQVEAWLHTPDGRRAVYKAAAASDRRQESPLLRARRIAQAYGGLKVHSTYRVPAGYVVLTDDETARQLPLGFDATQEEAGDGR